MALKIGDEFDSFEAFQNALKNFEDETFANFAVFSSVKLKTINPEHNATFKYKRVNYHCKFSGAAALNALRIRNTSTYKQNCGSKISASLKNQNGVFKFVVHSLNGVHNHETTRDIYASLPKQRQLLLQENETLIKRALPLKVNRQLLQTQFIKNQADNVIQKNVILKDIHNYAAKSK